MSNEPERRIASHPDDPTAPLADRLLLALGMWPSYVDELGVDAVLNAAVALRTNAHQLSFVSEDYGDVSARLAEAEELIEETLDCFDDNSADLGHVLDEMRRKLVDWVEYRQEEEEIVTDIICPNCGASASLPLGMSCRDHRPIPVIETCTICKNAYETFQLADDEWQDYEDTWHDEEEEPNDKCESLLQIRNDAQEAWHAIGVAHRRGEHS